MTFSDHFSGHAADYSEYRPRYPDSLFAMLASLCVERRTAWDCATGSGQAARSLSAYFDRVIATDASAQQLAQAQPADGVSYEVALAERTAIPPDSVDLVTVAQALHWFDIPAFAAEAGRVMKPGGVLAVWTYGTLTPGPGLNELLHEFHHDVVGDYWPFDRSVVETGYADVDLPFASVSVPVSGSVPDAASEPASLAPLEMTAEWRFADLLGYLNTWSSVKTYQQAHHRNPVDALEPALLRHWGEPDVVRTVTWPLYVRAWRNTA